MRLPSALPLLLAVAFASAAAAQTAAPTFTKAFAPETIGPGSISTLTFTIDNTEFGTPVTDLAFTDVLPAGMTVASPAGVTTTCTGGGGRDATPVISADEGAGTISFTGGAVPGSTSCRVRVNVTSATSGEHLNTTGDLTSSAGNSGSASATLTVDTGRPGFSKSFAPSTIALGGRSRLTFTIDNTENQSLVEFLSFTDTLPVGMVFASPALASTTCGTATIPPTLTLSGGTLSLTANGSGAFPVVDAGDTCTVGVDVEATDAGALANLSSELQVGSFPTVSAGKAGAVLTSQVGTLILTKSFLQDPVPPGGTVPLRFTLRNIDRGGTASGITFDDSLDVALPGLTVGTMLPITACGGTLGTPDLGATLVLSGATLASGQQCAFVVDVVVPEGAPIGEYVNETTVPTGTVAGNEVVGRRAKASLFVEPVPLLTKTFQTDTVAPGATVSLEFSVTNTSADFTATAVGFSDDVTDIFGSPVSATLPPDGVCGLGSTVTIVNADFDRQRVQLSGGTLGAGDSCSFVVDLVVPASLGGGVYTNTTFGPTATIDGQTVTGNPASDVLTVVEGVQISKFFVDDPVGPGGEVTLLLTLRNRAETGPSATDVAFTDDLSASLSGLAAEGGLNEAACGGTLTSSMDGSQIALSDGELAPGESCEISLVLTVPAAAASGTYPNTTSAVTSTVGGVQVTGPSATDALVVSAVRLAKAFVADPVAPGDPVTLKFTLTNDGTSAASGISFSDDLDATLAGLAASDALPIVACGGSLGGSPALLVYTGGMLAVGETCEFSVTLSVPATAADGNYPNTTSAGTATIGGNSVSIPAATDELDVSSVVLQPPTVAAAFAPSTIATGGTSQFTLTIDNLSSGAAASALAATATFPSAVAIADPAGTASSCGGTVTAVAGTNTVELSGGSVGAGASCAVSVNVTSATEGMFTATTTDLSSSLGTSPGASAKLTVDASAFRVRKTSSFVDADADGLFGPGEVLTYRLGLETSTLTETDLVLDDEPDPNTTVVPGSLQVLELDNGTATLTEGASAVSVGIDGFRGEATIEFQVVQKATPVADGDEVCNQAVLSGPFADIVSDDPRTDPPFDATCTPARFNTPPVAVAAADRTTAECTGAAGEAFALDGSGSSDPDGDALTYAWTGPFPEGGGTVTGVGPTVTLSLGESTVTLTVTDPFGASDSVDLVLTVEDTTPPALTVGTASVVLWPPNHRYHTIALADLGLAVVDACDAGLSAADVVVSEVSSDEPENGNGDGNTTDDIVIAPTCDSVDLRAERKGNGNGRVYAIDLGVADASGNVATATSEVAVPKSRNRTATRDAAAYTVDGCPAAPALADGETTPGADAPDTGAPGTDLPVATPAATQTVAVPEVFALGAAYPNPSGRSVRVEVDVPVAAAVRLAVYDALGREVAVLLDRALEAGRHPVVFDGSRLPAGTYLLRLTAEGGFAQTRPVTVLR